MPEDCVAVVLKAIRIVVPSVSPLTKPVAVAVKVGKAAPNCFEALAIVTVSAAGVMVSVPAVTMVV